MDAIPFTTASSKVVHPKKRILQNFVLIWLHPGIELSKDEYEINSRGLQSVVNNINIFTQQDECIDFVTDIEDLKVYLIIESEIGQQILWAIHDIPQLDAIYLFGDNKSERDEWIKQWSKVSGIYKDMKCICEALSKVAMQCNQDSIAVSFVTINEEAISENLNQLEPTFMYTQIIKEIFLEIDRHEQSNKNFIQFCRKNYFDNRQTLEKIARFEHEYDRESSITWYTRECFIYEILNRALRLMESDIIIDMGFFIRDLNDQIAKLHKQQFSNNNEKSFIVYRGQGLSKVDFEKLGKNKGGLLSFNSFLSTSLDRDISIIFAESSAGKKDTIGILFKMSINLSVSSTSFAFIRGFSQFETESEILFAMHTIFRIGEIQKSNSHDSLYEVELILTSDDDKELRILADWLRQEIVAKTGWHRLGQLLIKICQFEKAEELFNVLLNQTTKDIGKADCYNMLGYIKGSQGEHNEAISYHQRGIQILRQYPLHNDSALATAYTNIGGVYFYMYDYLTALSFYEKVLGIEEKILPKNNSSLATSYNNIATVYNNLREYSKALLFYQKGLDICKQSLPSNHPSLAIAYSNIGMMYDSMGDYSQALCFYLKALEIREKTLPPNHLSFAVSYNNISAVYQWLGEYSQALSFLQKSLKICRKVLRQNHPDLATCYNNMGDVYEKMGNYKEALSFHERGLEIIEKNASSNYSDWFACYNNIGAVYNKIGNYPKALAFHKKGLEIIEKLLPSDHPWLAICYSNIGGTYHKLGDYSKALTFHLKSLELHQHILSSDHPDLACSYGNIAGVHKSMKEYSEAIKFYQKQLNIYEKTLPPNSPRLATAYNNIGTVYNDIKEHTKAFSFYEKALEIYQTVFPADHPELAAAYNNIGMSYKSMKEYMQALLSYEKSRKILEATLPSNHPSLAVCYNNISGVYMSMGQYAMALNFCERALSILSSVLPSDHPSIETVQLNLNYLKKKL